MIEVTHSKESVSVRIEHRSMSRSKGQRHHDTRTSHVPNYVDKERIHLNSTIIQAAKESELRKTCEERRALRATKRQMKVDAAVATVGIITFSRAAQSTVEMLSASEQDRLFLMTAERIAERLGSDLTGLVVHRDESALHAHFQMPAVRRDGTPISKMCNIGSLLQDIAGEVWSEYGITRGVRKADRIAAGDDMSKIVHRSVKQLHEDLPKEIEALQTKLAKNERLLEAAESKLSEMSSKSDSLEKLVRTYEKRVKAAEDALAALERVLPRPKPKGIEVVEGVESSWFGLRQTVKTKKIGVIAPSELSAWAHSVAAEIERKDKRAEEAEKRAAKAERAHEFVSNLNAHLTQEIIELRPPIDVMPDTTQKVLTKEQDQTLTPNIIPESHRPE